MTLALSIPSKSSMSANAEKGIPPCHRFFASRTYQQPLQYTSAGFCDTDAMAIRKLQVNIKMPTHRTWFKMHRKPKRCKPPRKHTHTHTCPEWRRYSLPWFGKCQLARCIMQGLPHYCKLRKQNRSSISGQKMYNGSSSPEAKLPQCKASISPGSCRRSSALLGGCAWARPALACASRNQPNRRLR